MGNVRSEINYCLGNKSLVISLTNLVDLQRGKRGEGDKIWLEVKQKGDNQNFVINYIGLSDYVHHLRFKCLDIRVGLKFSKGSCY